MTVSKKSLLRVTETPLFKEKTGPELPRWCESLGSGKELRLVIDARAERVHNANYENPGVQKSRTVKEQVLVQ